MAKINNIKIGDTLYGYVSLSGTHEYKVIGIRTREGENNTLEVEDQNCNHGWNCQILVHQDSVGNLARSYMLNDVDDEYDSQGCWHTQGRHDYYLHTTKSAAIREVGRVNRDMQKEEVERLEKLLKTAKMHLQKYEEMVKMTEETLNS